MNAREIVTARIAEQARRYPDLLITPLETGDLDARDAALASAIDHAVVRQDAVRRREVQSLAHLRFLSSLDRSS